MHIVDEKNTKYHAASLWAQKKQNCSAWKKKIRTHLLPTWRKFWEKAKKIRTHLLLTLGNVVCSIYMCI